MDGRLLQVLNLHNLRRHAGGSWTAANCPCCGERSASAGDRLMLWPQEGETGRWACRRCGEHGDGLDLVRRFLGLDYRAACDVLGVQPSPSQKERKPKGKATWWTRLQRERKRKAAAVPVVPPAPSLPPLAWRRRLLEFWTDGQGALVHDPAAAAFCADRGLVPSIAAAAGLAWLPHPFSVPFEAVGLEPVNGRSRFVLPRGMLIPTWSETEPGQREIVAASVRLAAPMPGGLRYFRLPGVALRSVVFRPSVSPPDLVVIVEAALDAALIWQAAQGAVLAVATGSAAVQPDAEASAAIDAAVRAGVQVVICPDNDDAGRTAAERWRQRFPTAQVVPPVGGKDLTDADRAARHGVPGAVGARAWLKRLRRPSPSVDGQVSPLSSCSLS